MKLYHGSYICVPEPRVIPPGRFVDFGMGFYTTTDREQAVAFVGRYIKRGEKGIVSVYEYDDVAADKALSICRYPSVSVEWFHYVVANRTGRGEDRDFDIVMGPVANDSVYDVINGFEDGLYWEDEAIRRLLTFRLKDQVVFKTEKSLNFLSYVGSEEVRV